MTPSSPQPSFTPGWRPLRTSAVALLVGALLVAAVAPATAGRAPSTTPAIAAATTVGLDQGAYRVGIRVVTNIQRRNRGIPNLRSSACLNRAARRWANRLADRDRLQHQDLRPLLGDCKLRSVGENLALGHTHSRRTVRAWMGSSGHRSNLLNRSFTHTGVGSAFGPRGLVTVQLVGERR